MFSACFGNIKGRNRCFINELARFKFDSSNGVCSNLEDTTIRQRDFANLYTLMRNIIKLLSNAFDKQDKCISECSMVKAMIPLNESVR
jgi:hypothetical protein